MRSFKEDYTLGTNQEDILKPKLEEFFGDSYCKTDKFHSFDLKGRNSYIEIKTRTFEKNKFDTTIIPCSKLEFAARSDSKIYFVFVFTDGTYYIKYDPEVFKTFKVKLFKRQDRIDHRDKMQNYCYIPVNLLSQLV